MLASFIFFSPFTMIIGGALIASPIIIHLINRMRYKRIRWAAMEFLLKAQKRSRRKLIIEQLILLLLRILLILLVAVLLARLINRPDTEEVRGRIQSTDPEKSNITLVVNASDASPGEEQTFDVAADAKVEIASKPAQFIDLVKNMQVTLTLRSAKAIAIKADDVKLDTPPVTRHVVILDDTPSMLDRWKDRGQEVLAIDNARKMVLDYIVDVVKDASDPHEFGFIKMSSPKKPESFEPLTAESRGRINDFIRNNYKAGTTHADMLQALKKAKEALDESKEMNLILHIVSDFRETDWNDSTRDALGALFEHFEKAKVQVKLHDVASPLREAGDKPVQSSGNLAIVDFRPESRVVVKDMPMEFTVSVANFSNTDELNVFVRVRVNNEQKQDASVNIPQIRAGDTVSARMTFALSRTAPKDPALLQDGARKFDGFNLVSASIESEKGLAIDNVRYAFVEVRDKLPILLVDNNIAGRYTKNAESFYLWKLFSDTYKGFDVQVKTALDLDKANLQGYAAIILCDIPTLSETAVKKLETYVNGGGGVGFFMGQSIRDPKFYNEKLWKNGRGIFPAPLLEVANKQATPEQLNQILLEQRDSINRKLLVRNEVRRHPAMEKLYADSRGQNYNDMGYERIFALFDIARYFVVDPKWRPGDNVQTLLYRPNAASVSSYGDEMLKLLKKLRETVDEPTRRALLQLKRDETADENVRKKLTEEIDRLKTDMEKYAPYIPAVKEYSDIIRNTVGSDANPLYKLVMWLEVLMEDPGDPKRSPPLPSMAQFWQLEGLADLKEDFLKYLDKIKFGDPFYIAKQQGKGRVLAFLGAAGTSGPEGDYWSPLNGRGRVFFPPLMKDSLQRYLCSTSGDFFVPLAKPFDFELDPAVHDKDVHVWSIQEVEKPVGDEQKVKTGDLGARTIAGSDTELTYKFNDGKEQGLYLFDFSVRPTEGASKKDASASDLRALAYNFDGQLESNLLRARSEDLKSIARVERIETLDEKSLPQKISREGVRELPKKESDLGMSKSPWLFLGILLALILEQAWAVRLSFHTRGAAGPNIPQPVGRGTVTA